MVKAAGRVQTAGSSRQPGFPYPDPDPAPHRRSGAPSCPLPVPTTASVCLPIPMRPRRRLPRPTAGCGGPLQTTAPFRSATASTMPPPALSILTTDPAPRALILRAAWARRCMPCYEGVVVEIEDRDSAPYGQFVTLHSGTDPAANSGFLHTYAHLAGVAGAGVQLAAPVSKGQLLGGVRHQRGRRGTSACAASAL